MSVVLKLNCNRRWKQNMIMSCISTFLETSENKICVDCVEICRQIYKKKSKIKKTNFQKLKIESLPLGNSAFLSLSSISFICGKNLFSSSTITSCLNLYVDFSSSFEVFAATDFFNSFFRLPPEEPFLPPLAASSGKLAHFFKCWSTHLVSWDGFLTEIWSYSWSRQWNTKTCSSVERCSERQISTLFFDFLWNLKCGFYW